MQIGKAVALLASAKRPVIYSGGGVINSGPEASKLLPNWSNRGFRSPRP
jgi:acetolactate synthase-1/2/3 large subunit